MRELPWQITVELKPYYQFNIGECKYIPSQLRLQDYTTLFTALFSSTLLH